MVDNNYTGFVNSFLPSLLYSLDRMGYIEINWGEEKGTFKDEISIYFSFIEKRNSIIFSISLIKLYIVISG